jgi:hypothetical protein
MSSDRSRERARQLVLRADTLLQGPPQGNVWFDSPSIVLFANVALVGTVTGAIVLTISSRPAILNFAGILVGIAIAWTFAYIPGWLFVRFYYEQIPRKWNDYVLQLHRLKIDTSGNLPQPPFDSPYYPTWRKEGGEERSSPANLYQVKFDAHYGSCIAAAAMDRRRRISARSLSPILILISILSAGLTASLWHLASVISSAPLGFDWMAGSALGFLGVYTWGLALMVRRYAQGDLRAAVYTGVAKDLLLVVVAAAAAHPLLTRLGLDGVWLATAMYLLGVFIPMVFIPMVLIVVATVSGGRSLASTTEPKHPLTQLEHMGPYYEAMLLEEGIEELTHLLSLSVVDLLIDTRIPLNRFLDWVDQAALLVHLEDDTLKEQLRAIGVRSATNLLELFPGVAEEIAAGHVDRSHEVFESMEAHGIDRRQVVDLLRAVTAEPALYYVRAGSERPG